MAFRYWYNEIKEMVTKIALDPSVARDIVRKAGLRSGGGAEGAAATLPPEFSSPTRFPNQIFFPSTTSGLWRRRGSNLNAWPPGQFSGSSNLKLQYGAGWWSNDGSIGKQSLPQTHYNRLHFTSYSEKRRPSMGIRLIETPRRSTGNPFTPFQEPGIPKQVAAHTYVTGKTFYDPFPFPSAPLYFWADLSEHWMMPRPFIKFPDYTTPFARGVDPYRGSSAPFGNQPLGANTGPMLLRTMCSIDGGSTWHPPFYPMAVDSTPDDLSTISNVINEDSAYGTMLLNGQELTGTFGNAPAPTFTEPGYVASNALRREFFRDDVLFKFTLEVPSTDYWIIFQDLGIGVVRREANINVARSTTYGAV